MAMPHRGDPVSFEFSSADASAGSGTLTIRRAGNTSVAYTLAANERLVINSLTAVLASGANPAVIYDDANANNAVDAGERLFILGTGVNDIASFEGPDNGQAGGLGRAPKVKAAAAGQIDIAGNGYIQTT
jgi:hypothetical protein